MARRNRHGRRVSRSAGIELAVMVLAAVVTIWIMAKLGV